MMFNKYSDVGWVLAIRKQEDQILINQEKNKKFSIIKNPWRYWCADPFLFNNQDEEYIFCEAYDILKEKGVIAYRKIRSGKVTKLKVCLECDWHLSYPYVFKYNNEVYMVPETSAIDQVILYKAINFPDKWEKCGVLLDNKTACDTNFIERDGMLYMFTLIFDKTSSKYVYDKLYMYYWTGTCFQPCQKEPVLKDACIARNGGKFVICNEDTYRVSQNCCNGYGNNIVISKVDSLDKTNYSEHIVKEIYPSDINLNAKNIYDGIHTYNLDGKYEIIDLKRDKWFRWARIIYLIINKLKNNIF